MAFPRGPLASLVRFALLTLVGVCPGAFAQEPAVQDEDAIQLDQTIQVLKDEATQLEAEVQAARQTYLYPPNSRLAVYLSNGTPNFLLERVTISVNGNNPSVHEYDEFSSRALLVEGALQELLLTNIERGAHRMKLTVFGAYPNGEPISAQHELAFDKRFEASEFEIEIVPGKRGGPPAFRVREWRQAGQ